ncbi:MAG TPA: PaaX family transcriptional regulator C-terminal domain-containing protein [Acetobacteraceae bacterium]|nr:PaaX family transcriptional regulator C-terminal domain-containing protein [Acetobacteraceae bacterium]
MDQQYVINSWLERLHARHSRLGALILTMMGDAFIPRGGAVALSSILEICAAMGFAGGAVRTAMSRLQADLWLESNRVGRASFYAPHARGKPVFAASIKRIYGPRLTLDEAPLRLIVLDQGAGRDALRTRLERLGYGQLAPSIMVAPATGPAPELGGGGYVLTASAAASTMRPLATRIWPITDIATQYRHFIETYEAIQPDDLATLTPRDALIARFVLIHDYRLIILNDPALPNQMLPPDWPGPAARQICAALYKSLISASESHISDTALGPNGPLPPPNPPLALRFPD